MTSQYGYATVSDLETFTSTDYSVVDASYTDTVIESWLTNSERLVNGFTGTTFTSTIPDSIKLATQMIAQKIARNKMIDDNHITRGSNEIKSMKLLDDDVKEILKSYKDTYDDAQGIWVVKG